MNIFALIDSDQTITSVSDEILSKLSFLEETDESYDEYMSISNECAMTSALLYETVGLEDFKESVKKGFKYILNKMLKAVLYIGNLFRKLIHKLSLKKTTLILKQCDENMKTYEVAHPEVVDEADKFFKNFDFDSVEEVQYEAVKPETSVVKIKSTFLYRVLVLSKIIQDNSEFKANLNLLSNRFKNVHFNANIMKEFDGDGELYLNNKGSFLNLINYSTGILSKFADDVRKLNKDTIDIDSDIIREFSDSYNIKSDNKFKAIFDMSQNINKLFSEIYPKRDEGHHDLIEAAMQKYGNGKASGEYLQWKYKKDVFKVVESIERSLNNGLIQSALKAYDGIRIQLQGLFERLTKNDYRDYKIIIDNLNNWLIFINNNSTIADNINRELSKLKNTAYKYKTTK